MNVLIIEDESPAARRLKLLIDSLGFDIQIINVLESVTQAVTWLQRNENPDLIFMDIQLGDGISFEIFSKVEIKCPVIFTTAYDEYALKAFKVNSIDYLLKPISKEDLELSFQKYFNIIGIKQLVSNAPSNTVSLSKIEKLLEQLQLEKTYKSRLLVKVGDKLSYIELSAVAYFLSEDKLVYAISFEGKRFPLDYSLDELDNILDPKIFFRLNRQFIAKINAIQTIHNYFNGKLKLLLNPATTKEVIVSREKASVFKQWLEV